MRLLVAAADGYLYVYNLDSNEGGDLSLLKQHRLDGRSTDTIVPATSQVDGAASAAGSGTRSEPKPVKPSKDTGNIFYS